MSRYRWMSSRFRYSSSRRRRPTSISRPRRLWWSCLWSLRCSVRSAIRVVRTAIWTSAEPVSPVGPGVLRDDCGLVVFRQRHSRTARLPAPTRRPTRQRQGLVGGSRSRGRVHVGLDRRHELVDRVVPHLVAQPRPELDRERLPGQVVPLEIEQERLDVQRLDAERGVRPDVERRAVPTAVVARPRPRRSPGPAGAAGATCARFAVGYPRPLPAAVPGHDLAVEDEPPAEGLARPVEVARRRAPRGSRWTTRCARRARTSGTASAVRP